MPRNIFWGCDQSLQLESSWILDILSFSSDHFLSCNILIESGLLFLERSPSKERIDRLYADRSVRLDLLREEPLLIIHLSDEEGIDGDTFYPTVPADCVVWRNFHHRRFSDDTRIRSFPIGPRKEFLVDPVEMLGLPSSERTIPWSFMGTLWSSGSRTLAASLFLRSLPNGFFYGGKRFGAGLPIAIYRHRLQHSIFALAPEGDRHLDTFRLWESLCCGCIPIVVDHCDSARFLFHSDYPGPVFPSWPVALDFVQSHLHDLTYLTSLQNDIQSWWLGFQRTLPVEVLSGFLIE